MAEQKKVDITPHPRILKVLGEIEFKPWQCVAELVDNSIDGFLDNSNKNLEIDDPVVRVAFGRDTVVVQDNGPGMSIIDLEKAVKAGWTSHEPFGSLGLYGVGFNIATARLGSVTTIWTTRLGDENWFGLELDLNKIVQGGNFILDTKTRIKSNKKTSGTEINISNLRNDWKSQFTNTTWIRNNVTDKLSRIYGTMIRNINPKPIHFSLYINDKKASAWEHCVWPADWSVYRKNEGSVRPILEIDQRFGKKFLYKKTGLIVDIIDEKKADDYIEIPERVYGWIGIQRYADEKDFGIDILRNGRKIEIGCKDIFEWENIDGDIRLEYPIDDPRGRGRIVGELHLDHGYVHYTKDRFEREHASWKQLLLALRNNEPLVKREDHGFDKVNTSPLGVLFRTFRRNTPLQEQSWRDYLFIQDNDKAKAWAQKRRKRDSEYLNDDIWETELISLGKNSKNTLPVALAPTTSINFGNGDPNVDKSDLEDSADGVGGSLNPNTSNIASKNAPGINRKPLPEHKLHISSGVSQTGKSYDFEVFDLSPVSNNNNTNGTPWTCRATTRGVYEIDVDLTHSIFNSASFQLADAILIQAAHIITSEEQASLGSRNISDLSGVLTTLRLQFVREDSLDPISLSKDVETLRKIFVKHISKLQKTQKDILLKALLPSELSNLKFSASQSPSKSTVTDFLSIGDLVKTLEMVPETFFAMKCFEKEWTPADLSDEPELLEKHRAKLMSDILVPFKKIAEFSTEPTANLIHNQGYLSFIRACITFCSKQVVME